MRSRAVDSLVTFGSFLCTGAPEVLRMYYTIILLILLPVEYGAEVTTRKDMQGEATVLLILVLKCFTNIHSML